jgi:hypothetical protein
MIEHADKLRRHGPADPGGQPRAVALTVRAASHHKPDALSRLAGRHGRASPGGHALLAERDGIAIAAIALTSGTVLTDHRHGSGDAVRLLRLHRYQLLRQGGDVGHARSLLHRLAPAR